MGCSKHNNNVYHIVNLIEYSRYSFLILSQKKVAELRQP